MWCRVYRGPGPWCLRRVCHPRPGPAGARRAPRPGAAEHPARDSRKPTGQPARTTPLAPRPDSHGERRARLHTSSPLLPDSDPSAPRPGSQHPNELGPRPSPVHTGRMLMHQTAAIFAFTYGNRPTGCHGRAA
ncbi:hypothetical protein GCM10023335_64030 [Streptomyces siamensis]|uniref:Uncharacterized protein n=1 Tax=Streptomyces siamensis TaxID=1274986 RepID=A0ABP9JC37_9ACTN